MSTLASVIVRDIYANIPAAGITGRLFFASDTGNNYRDNGTTWDLVDGVGSGGTVTAVTGTAPIVSSGGAAPAISISAATSAALGSVKPDGTIITVAAGAITVPKATSSAFGVVEVDGTTITASAGVISAVAGAVAAPYGSYTDILSESKLPGTAGSSSAKNVSLANNATQTLLNLTGQSGGYVSYLWIGFNASDTASTMVITTDGNTVFSDRACLFFGAEYISNQSSFASRFIGASSNNSNNVGFYSFIPIPFNASISITFTNKSGGTASVFYEVFYQNAIADNWKRTKKLWCASGTIAAATAYSAQTLLNASSLSQGRLLGIAFSIDSYPGSANPPTAPLEGYFKIYLDGAGSPAIQSSGTEDYIGLSNYFQGFPATPGGNAATPYTPAYSGITIKSTYTWNAYRFHIIDPIVFQNAIKVTWDNGESAAVSFTGTTRFAYCIWYYTE